MRILAPWETAWPAGVGLLLLWLGLARSGLSLRTIGPRTAALAAVVGLCLRLLWVPALGRHLYDGHEAEYWSLFVGERAPSRGGTVLYPAMQWLWAGLGAVLPHHEAVPVVIMALVGVGGALALGEAVGRLGGARAGQVALGLALVHPGLVAWSSSAYNVILPWSLGCLAFLLAVEIATRHRPQAALGLAWGAAALLTVACRLDAALILGPSLAVLLVAGPAGPRERLRALAPAGIGLLLLIPAVYPLVWPGELPGAGERALAFAVHRGWAWPLGVLGQPVGVVALLLGAGLALRRSRALPLLLLGGSAVSLLLLDTFDDLGERHILVLLPAAFTLIGLGVQAAPRLGLLPAALLGMGLGAELFALRTTYYGREEDFAASLPDDLPRWSPAVALGNGAGCGIVDESGLLDPGASRSEFNLLDAAEAEGLRGPGGCLWYCADALRWRWSSRAVADRAARLAHLYALRPRAVVVGEADMGYSCLLYEVGPRRCCAADPLAAPSSPAAGVKDERGAAPADPPAP